MEKIIDCFTNKHRFSTKILLFLCLFETVFFYNSSSFAQIPTNTWRTHANYSQAKGLEIIQNQGKVVKVYGFSANGFFYFNPTDNSTKILSRIDGFSETTITQIRYNATTQTLLIAYQSGILDFVELNNDGTPKAIHSIDFIKTTDAIQGSRIINQIAFQDNIGYLASDFGLVVLDIAKKEIKETYQNIGKNGEQVALKNITFARDSIFVLTSNEILGAKFSPTINLQFYENWKKITDNQLFTTIIIPKDNLITQPNEIEQDANGKLWIADEKNGLLSNFSGKFQQYSPNGVGQNTNQLGFSNNQIYAISGTETSIFNNNEWQKLASNKVPSFSTDVIDIFGFRWKIMSNGIRVINETNGQFRNFGFGKGSGNLPSSSIYSLALDKDGLLWIGTGNGVAVIIPTKDIFSTTTEAYTPFYKTRRLLLQEVVTKIVVDGGNRKWIGTQNGLNLFSSSAEEQIYNFTEENSPLPSKNIVDLAIDSFSGELFVLTQKGLVSYRTDASEANENLNEVKIFPNPVRPAFDGDLSISGLKENTFVKITDIAGKLIYETTSNGGTATWNLNNQFGNRAETGIYLVFCVDSNKTESFVGKVAVLK